LPKDPNGYELKLPDNFVAPQGIEFNFNEKDPAIALAREFAHKNGLSQEQFSGMAAIYAATRVQELAAFAKANQAEVEKLGATGTQRVTAIQNFLRGHLGDEIAAPFMKTLVTETMVRGWERIMQRISNGGVSSPSMGGREAPEDRTGKIANYDGMSFEQRRAAQERVAGRR
jgi:hypothetical protein